MNIKARTIIEEECVRKEIDSARNNSKRIEKLWDGLVFRLARGPEDGTAISHMGRTEYAMKVDPDIRPLELPGIVAVYTYNEDEVNVSFLKIYSLPQ